FVDEDPSTMETLQAELLLRVIHPHSTLPHPVVPSALAALSLLAVLGPIDMETGDLKRLRTLASSTNREVSLGAAEYAAAIALAEDMPVSSNVKDMFPDTIYDLTEDVSRRKHTQYRKSLENIANELSGFDFEPEEVVLPTTYEDLVLDTRDTAVRYHYVCRILGATAVVQVEGNDYIRSFLELPDANPLCHKPSDGSAGKTGWQAARARDAQRKERRDEGQRLEKSRNTKRDKDRSSKQRLSMGYDD
ncbi:hypothetical protein KIPB_007044, partial [Kipferlia bialata]